MQRKQAGFTLIELVVVIVILGILAATAIPKFVDMSTEAGNAAANGVAGTLASATAVNYAAKLAGKSSAVALSGTNAATCSVASLGGLVSGISLTDGVTTAPTGTNVYGIGSAPGAPDCSGSLGGTTTTCQILGSKGGVQTATIICTGS